MMTGNFHTHTTRCNHAYGTEREYIEAAIEKGFKVLGFSDHVPQPFPDYVSSVRMAMDDIPDYTGTLLRLRDEYSGRIKILIGYEVEYTKKYFGTLIKKLREFPLDYIIQGQHFSPDEPNGFYAGEQTDDESRLRDYVDLTVEGMGTGLFSYLAHPDLINFTGSEKLYMEQMEKLVAASIDFDVPLEVNMLGFATGRNYPCDRFFSLASSMGAKFIVGCDAHSPDQIRQIEDVPGFSDFIKRNKIVFDQNLKTVL